MVPGKKIEYIRQWQYAHLFSERQLEYLALEVVKLSLVPKKAPKEKITEAHTRSMIHKQLDEVWESLLSFDESDRPTLMTRPSEHPEVQAILR